MPCAKHDAGVRGTEMLGKVEITDKDGNPLKKDDLIPPEATITVKSNNAFYKWNQVAGGVTAILTAISTVLSIYMIATNQ